MSDYDLEFRPPGGIPISLTPVDEGEWTITAQRDDDLFFHVRAGPTADKLRAVPLGAQGTINDGTNEAKVRVRTVEPMADGGVKVTYDRMSFSYKPEVRP